VKAIHEQRKCDVADVVLAEAIIIGYATLTHVYDSQDCSTVCISVCLFPVSIFYDEKTIPQCVSNQCSVSVHRWSNTFTLVQAKYTHRWSEICSERL